MNRLRVLKLGWEFPPLINGGLGIACLGLARALAKHVDLTVVVPQSSPEADFKEFDLRGVNQLSLETLKPAEGRYRYESFAQVRNVPIFLDPYGDGEIAERRPPRPKFSPRPPPGSSPPSNSATSTARTSAARSSSFPRSPRSSRCWRNSTSSTPTTG